VSGRLIAYPICANCQSSKFVVFEIARMIPLWNEVRLRDKLLVEEGARTRPILGKPP